MGAENGDGQASLAGTWVKGDLLRTGGGQGLGVGRWGVLTRSPLER